jgi:hypothetical protein
MDKNGKLVTRNVRSGPVQPSLKNALPAPVASVQPKRKVTAKKPLEKQLKVQQRMGSRSYHSPAPALYEALKIDKPENLWDLTMISASDVQMYDVFSVVRTDDAVLLMDRGYTTSEKVVELLEENNLTHLLIDRRDLMTEAQNRRIDAWNFMEAQHKFGINDMECDQEMLLGAVRLDDSVSLPRWTEYGVTDSYAHHVIRGDISYEDVMTIGITNLSGRDKESIAPHLCALLNDLHTGKANYDAELLGTLLQKSNYHEPTLRTALGMVSEYGPQFMGGIKHLDSAIKINDDYRNRTTAQRAEMIDYYQQGLVEFYDAGIKDVMKLYDNNIPVEDAKAMLGQKMDVDRIIAAHKEGVTKSVSSGWL